jgi:hypothetical protein
MAIGESIGAASARCNSVPDDEDVDTTMRACAWLTSLAEVSEKAGVAPRGVAEWLERVGRDCHAELVRRGLRPEGRLQ